MTHSFTSESISTQATLNTKAALSGQHLATDGDGLSITVSLADFVANPDAFARAFQAVPVRPVQLRFV